MFTRRLSSAVLMLALLLPLVGPSSQTPQARAAAAQTTVTLNAVADATVREWEPDTNFGGDPSLELSYGGPGEEAVTLVRFDLSGLPPDAVVDSASLRLFLEGASGADPVSIGAYLITSAWDESTVTWNTPFTTGLFGFSASIDATVGSYKSWSVTSYAQSWIDDPSSNFGVMLRGPTEGANYERVFASREHLERVPQLELTYHLTPYTFTGHVYEGEPGDTSTPLEGVTVELWGDEDEWPEGGADRVLLASDLPTGPDGAFEIAWDRGTPWPYLHVIETDPADAFSTGATADSPGHMKNFNVISYRQDDLLETGLYDFGGIAFWDRFPEEEFPDLIVTDIWPQGAQICFEVQNVGAAIAPGGHQATLAVDTVVQDSLVIGGDLASTATWEGCFDHTWVCTEESDTIVVSADTTDVVAESDETNNRLERVWACDRTPPQIVAGPTVSNLTATSAVISWETDEIADSVVRYDTLARAYRFEELDPAPTINHEVALTGLTPSTTYHFVVNSTDPAGNSVESRDLIFETAAAPDTRNPTVELRAPEVMTGTVTIGADADDDTDVKKVEFYLNDDLVFTDYTPPYEWVFATDDVENGDYVLKVKAIDLYGNSIVDQTTVPVLNFVDADAPTVNIFFPSPGADVYGDTRVWVTVSDDSGWSEVEWFVDGKKLGGGQYPVSPSLDIMFWWDTTYFSQGSHSLAVKATDGDGKEGSDVIGVNVANAAPPPAPKLVVTRHEVFRHAHTFAIELTVQNKGNAAASGIQIVDPLRGFQPIARVFNGVTYETQLNTSSMQADAIIKDPASLAAGASRTYYLATVPVLVHDNPPVPSIGATLQLSYKGPSGPQVQESAKFEVLKTMATAGSAPSEPLGTAHSNAVGQADYLIVTNPSYLSFHNPFHDIKPVLSDMAALAFAKQGVLGYLRTSDRHTLRDLVMPNGNWGKMLSSDFRTTAEGYLLIVGETEIIPAWRETHWNLGWGNFDCRTREADISDLPYADTGGSNAAPELVVGRVIGNDATVLSRALQAGLNGSFDRSHYLLVSGMDKESSIQSQFTGSINEIEKVINCTNCVTKLHWSTFTPSQWVPTFRNNTADKDVILYQGHGGPDSWGPLETAHLQSTTQPISFGSTNPVVLGWACLTGSYENHVANRDPAHQCTFDGGDDNLAEAFLERGAAVYIGSTEVSEIGNNRAGAKALFQKFWKAGTTIGNAFTKVKQDRWSSSGYAQLWVYEYNLYGDPKYGATTTGSATADVGAHSEARTAQPASSIDVVVPDYEVTVSGDVHEVEIPGGDLLLDPGDYRIPYYREILTYPPGYEIQDVVMTDRSGMVTDSGLNLPVNEARIASPAGSHPVAAEAAAEWTPEEAYGWEARQDPDGTITLIITMYPFLYDSATTDIRFYKNYSFAIEYTVSPVTITAMSTDQDEYEEGEPVQAEIWLKNTGAAQDVSVTAVIKTYPTEEPAVGLALQTLAGLTGVASFAHEWDTEGFDPGGYTLEVTLTDAQNQILDRSTRMFHLGVASGQATDLSVTPLHFKVGDTIDASLVFENTGSLDLTGTAVIKVQDEEGTLVEEFKQAFNDLAPGATTTLDVDWDTTGVARGDYALVGYALYDGMATEPEVVTVSTERRIYLPVVYRVRP
ncbi:MAG: DNRLRE domain-containing protein [Anaerolineae bacterium]